MAAALTHHIKPVTEGGAKLDPANLAGALLSIMP